MATPPTPAPQSEMGKLIDAIGAAIRQNRPQGPLEQAGFSPERIAELTEPPAPKRWREVPCKSDDTGATFTAVVVESKSFKEGRIIEIRDYQHPKGVATFQKDGGLVPDGMQIMRAGMAGPDRDPNTIPKQDYTPFYLQWRWAEFWKRDLRRFAGSELKPSMMVSTTPIPWLDGKVRVSGDDT